MNHTVSGEQLNLHRFLKLTGPMLLMMGEQSFKEQDAEFGALLFNEFNKICTSKPLAQVSQSSKQSFDLFNKANTIIFKATDEAFVKNFMRTANQQATLNGSQHSQQILAASLQLQQQQQQQNQSLQAAHQQQQQPSPNMVLSAAAASGILSAAAAANPTSILQQLRPSMIVAQQQQQQQLQHHLQQQQQQTRQQQQPLKLFHPLLQQAMGMQAEPSSLVATMGGMNGPSTSRLHEPGTSSKIKKGGVILFIVCGFVVLKCKVFHCVTKNP
jgi:hypothetical protein